MSVKKIISGYVHYNHWANQTLTQWLKTLDNNLLTKETHSSFLSIDFTLQHMKNAQNFWLSIIREIERPDETIKINLTHEVIHDLLASSQQMIDIFTAYTEEELQQPVQSDTMTQSRHEFILHMINHNSYHRGQIVTMARGFGVANNIPETDYEAFLWGMKNS
jgi:uncharacterized damage-inducible protein DinB